MKLFTKLYEMIDALVSMSNALDDIRDIMKYKGWQSIQPEEEELSKIKHDPSIPDFIPTVNTDGLSIKSKKIDSKKVKKNFSEISKKIKEED